MMHLPKPFIEAAVQMVEKGAKLIATNLDLYCPTPKGIRPGCGAIVSMIEKATGIEAFSVGKPSPIMMREARKEMGLDAAATFMIGDTMSTDILGGIQMGYKTIIVLSGSTCRDDMKNSHSLPIMWFLPLRKFLSINFLSAS